MIKNFITYTDLTTYKEPRLLEWQKTTATLTSKILDGFKETCGFLNKNGIDTRLVMTPFYLATGLQTISSSVTGSWILAQRKNRVKRLVIEKVTCTDGGGGNVWYVDGSNDNGTTWTNIKTLNNTTGAGTISVSFDEDNEYSYYRYRFVKATSISFTGYIYMVETSFDDLIMLKSLEKIFYDLVRQENDIHSTKSIKYATLFDSALSSLHYSYDADESGVIDDDESVRRKFMTIRTGY
jgi:prepilin-type processing-associated H-X9-DG protein